MHVPPQCGICCVGAASLLTGEGSATHPISQWQMLGGMALIILSQVPHQLSGTHSVDGCHLWHLRRRCTQRHTVLTAVRCYRSFAATGASEALRTLLPSLHPALFAECLQAVQAAQITFEDFFLSSMDISALKIVGFEGVWGTLAMFLVMLPIVQHLPGAEGSGIHENSLDTWHVGGLHS